MWILSGSNGDVSGSKLSMTQFFCFPDRCDFSTKSVKQLQGFLQILTLVISLLLLRREWPWFKWASGFYISSCSLFVAFAGASSMPSHKKLSGFLLVYLSSFFTPPCFSVVRELPHTNTGTPHMHIYTYIHTYLTPANHISIYR